MYQVHVSNKLAPNCNYIRYFCFPSSMNRTFLFKPVYAKDTFLQQWKGVVIVQIHRCCCVISASLCFEMSIPQKTGCKSAR